MKNCDECGELIGDMAARSPWSGRLLCTDCLLLFGEHEDEDGPLDLEDRLERALCTPHPTINDSAKGE